MKQYPTALLPDTGLKSKIEQLYFIFKEATSNINPIKLTLIDAELIETINKYIILQAPRIVATKNNLEEVRINKKNTNINLKAPNILLQRPKAPSHLHRYPIQSAVVKAAKSMQIEEA